MIRALCIISFLLIILLVGFDLKKDLEIIKTQQYIQTLTLRQILGCYND